MDGHFKFLTRVKKHRHILEITFVLYLNVALFLVVGYFAIDYEYK